MLTDYHQMLEKSLLETDPEVAEIMVRLDMDYSIALSELETDMQSPAEK